MAAVVIEEHDASGVHWGVSINSANPWPRDYFACESAAKAFQLKRILDGPRPECNCPSAWLPSREHETWCVSLVPA